MSNNGSSGLEVIERRWVTRSGLHRLLQDLNESPGCLTSHYRRPESLTKHSEESGLSEIKPIIGHSETGAAVFMWEGQTIVVLPPFPCESDVDLDGCATTSLGHLVDKDRLVAVVMVRLGRYAVGVVDKSRLVTSKVDTYYVKNRHRAGGSSQRRFERSRERLIRELFDKTCGVTKVVLEPYQGRIDHLFLSGEAQTLRGFTNRCPFMKVFASVTMERILDVRRPSLNVLEHIQDEVWKSRVLVLARS